MNEIINKAEVVQKLKQLIVGGIEMWVEAADLYVDVIDHDPAAKEVIQNELADSIPRRCWGMLESVGRRQCHPRMLVMGSAFGKKSPYVKRLPYSDQERVVNGDRFKLLIENGEVLEVSVVDATPEQVNQLCSVSGIRTLPEQKAWVSSQIHPDPEEERAEPPPYRVCGKKVIFRRGVELTKRELSRIISGM